MSQDCLLWHHLEILFSVVNSSEKNWSVYNSTYRSVCSDRKCLHGVSANSYFCSFSPCKATSLTIPTCTVHVMSTISGGGGKRGWGGNWNNLYVSISSKIQIKLIIRHIRNWGVFWPTGTETCFWSVVAERSSLPDSSSGVQQNVGSNPGRDTCVLEQDT